MLRPTRISGFGSDSNSGVKPCSSRGRFRRLRLREDGVRVLNVTVSLPLDDERLYASCAEAGVTINRVIFGRKGLNYWEAEKTSYNKYYARPREKDVSPRLWRDHAVRCL